MSEPVRSCVGCRTRAPQSELVRLARVGQDVQISRTAPGRGAWVHPSADCLAGALRKGTLTRALRAQVVVDPEALLAAIR